MGVALVVQTGQIAGWEGVDVEDGDGDEDGDERILMLGGSAL